MKNMECLCQRDDGTAAEVSTHLCAAIAHTTGYRLWEASCRDGNFRVYAGTPRPDTCVLISRNPFA